MAMTRVETQPAQSTVLPPQEARDLFDRNARALLNMSGEEFLRQWDAGEFRNLPENAETRKVMRVVSLIPFGRR